MKKRSLFTLMLVAILAFSLGMGTLAYYTKTFESNGNIVRAAKFIVESDGTLDKDIDFDLTDDPLIPGKSKDLYEFKINKTGTEVPVRYEITATGTDELFYSGTPLKLNVYRKTDDGGWERIQKNRVVPNKNIEQFKVEAVWKHSDNDIHYQNKNGKVNIKVVATQTDGETTPDPDNPDEPVKNPEAKVYYKLKKGSDTRVTINVENIEYAKKVKFEFKYKKDKTYTSKIFKLGEEFKLDDDYTLPEDIKVFVYAEDGKVLLHTFENVTPEQVY